MRETGLRDQLKARSFKSPTEPFTLLFVCTGNICRSPLAAQLFSSRIDSVGLSERIRVMSAGTQAAVGQPMPPEAARLSVDLGADPSAHRARELTSDLIGEADLILALAREHRSAVVRMSPRASVRTFTLIEFSRLLSASVDASVRVSEPEPKGVPEFLRRMVERAAGQRGLVVGLDNPEADDVIDPYRRSVETYQRSAAQIVSASSSMVESVMRQFGSRSAGGVT